MENLPRCNALDMDARRCRKRSGIVVDYHGNGEPVTWVRVNLCIEHAINAGYDFAAPKKK